MHPLVQLARETVETYVLDKRIPDKAASLPTELPAKAGCFVTIYSREKLRGCIGTIEPAQDCLASEVILNAISAATRDPRFPAIVASELVDLDIKVDVLTEPEPVTRLDELDPKRYGVIVESARTAAA